MIRGEMKAFSFFRLTGASRLLGACGALAWLVSGCDQGGPGPGSMPAPASPEAFAPVQAARPSGEKPPAEKPAPKPAADAAPSQGPLQNAPRRGYGGVDMRFNDCVTRSEDQSLHGKNCPSGISVYGPYVNVPPSSEIDINFEIKAEAPAEVFADLVARMGGETLGALNPQTLAAGEKRKLGYRIHAFAGHPTVESRIGLSSASGPVSFEISNYTMVVR